MNRDACLRWISDTQPALLVMAGAGDIDNLINEVVLTYQNEHHA